MKIAFVIITVSAILGILYSKHDRLMEDCQNYAGTQNPIECVEQLKYFHP